jgi:hypothetical protein
VTAIPLILERKAPDEVEEQTVIEFVADADVLAEGNRCACSQEDDNPY